MNTLLCWLINFSIHWELQKLKRSKLTEERMVQIQKKLIALAKARNALL